MKIFNLVILSILSLGNLSQAQIHSEIYWTKSNAKIQLKSASGSYQFSDTFSKILEVQVPSICRDWVDGTGGAWQTATCVELECSGSGSGKSPAWDAFYAAKKDQKAIKLASAIKGIGKASAEKLVSAGAFSSKPRSWSEFKSEIKKAETSGVISAQVSSMVLNQYQSDNRSTLGYSSADCRTNTYSCQQWVEGTPGYYHEYDCLDTQSQTLETRSMNFTVNVQGAVLQSFETENLNIIVSPDLNDLKVDGAYYNIYRATADLQGSFGSINISGQSRNLVQLPKAAVQNADLNYYSADRIMQFSLALDSKYLNTVPSEAMVLEYTVRTCTPGWTGFCKPGWDKVQSPQQVVLTQPLTRLNLTVTAGDKAEVEYKLYKATSSFYSANPIVEKTSTVKAK
jgi:hypothetical protein